MNIAVITIFTYKTAGRNHRC